MDRDQHGFKAESETRKAAAQLIDWSMHFFKVPNFGTLTWF